jgi:hypothetical protein
MAHNPEPPAVLTTTSSNINVNVYVTISCSGFVLARLKSLSLRNSRYFLSSHIDACHDSVIVVLIGMQMQKHVNSKEDSKCENKVC